MINALPPATILILGALPLLFLKGKAKGIWLLILPIISFVNLLAIPVGSHWSFQFLNFEIVLGKVDKLSLIFGYIFHIIAFISNLYAWHVDDRVQNIAGTLYAGAALGVTFAGDLFSLFVFWEALTITATFLILARRTRVAIAAGARYFMVHVAGGLCLLAGIIIQVQQTGSAAFGYIGLESLGSYLIFIGVGVNCAWPFLHSWLVDAYPEATITGTIFLSAFTTKTAVYFLARAFPGTEALIWIGAAMAGFPIFYAVIENDLRRVLAYSLINQVGFMVVGIGIGTHLAINGAVAHAFNDILFKGLLFMTMGAVMYRTGKINATDLGGLYKSMPWTCTFCIVGAASISAFPLFSGFVSKSMVMEAAAHGDMRFVWFVLLFASAGVFHHAGIKIPFFRFLLTRFRVALQGSAETHAAGHGIDRCSLHFYRQLSEFPLRAPALRDGLCALQCQSRDRPDPVAVLLGSCLRLAAALRDLSGRNPFRQYRRGPDLPERRALAVPRLRQDFQRS